MERWRKIRFERWCRPVISQCFRILPLSQKVTILSGNVNSPSHHKLKISEYVGTVRCLRKVEHEVGIGIPQSSSNSLKTREPKLPISGSWTAITLALHRLLRICGSKGGSGGHQELLRTPGLDPCFTSFLSLESSEVDSLLLLCWPPTFLISSGSLGLLCFSQ